MSPKQDFTRETNNITKMKAYKETAAAAMRGLASNDERAIELAKALLDGVGTRCDHLRLIWSEESGFQVTYERCGLPFVEVTTVYNSNIQSVTSVAGIIQRRAMEVAYRLCAPTEKSAQYWTSLGYGPEDAAFLAEAAGNDGVV